MIEVSVVPASSVTGVPLSVTKESINNAIVVTDEQGHKVVIAFDLMAAAVTIKRMS